MRKPHRFNDLSDRRCTACGNRLKKNLLAKKPGAKLCWRCFYPQRNPNFLNLCRKHLPDCEIGIMETYTEPQRLSFSGGDGLIMACQQPK
ncbi:hypothetical protein ES708_03956 [subsurface metagenome]